MLALTSLPGGLPDRGLPIEGAVLLRAKPNTGFASGLEVALQPLVPEGPDHAMYSILYRYKIQSLS